MPNRCNSCSKLCGLETQEPEIDFQLDDRGVSYTVRLARASACCGDEVKEANFDGEKDLSDAFQGHTCDEELTGEAAIARARELVNTKSKATWTLTLAGVNSDEEITVEQAAEVLSASPERAGDVQLTVEHELEVEENGTETTERTEGKGRGTKSFYGFEAHFQVTCACGVTVHEGTIDDEMQASAFDELG